jgi:hypothetical protein
MTVRLIRSTINEGNVADVQGAVERIVQEMDETQIAGVRYASGRLNDGVTFIALVEFEDENGGGNPLFALPAYADLLENLKQWAAAPPVVEEINLIGSYRMF